MKQETMDKLVEFVRQKIKDYKSMEVEWFGREPMLEMEVIRIFP